MPLGQCGSASAAAAWCNGQQNAISNQTVWAQWCNPIGNYASSTGCNTYVWASWNVTCQDTTSSIVTENTVADRERRAAKELEAKQAKERAEALLLQNLDAEQVKQFRAERCFVVQGRDRTRRYKVTYGTAGNIRLLSEHGEAIAKFCIHPDIQCPTEDVMLAQKLMIEGDEKGFLRVANRTQLLAA